jgi:uncharacterized protein (DUF362 family)
LTAESAKTNNAVAVVGCSNYEPANVTSAIERIFSLLGGGEKFICKSDRVLLKPNFITAAPAWQAVQTDPAVILAVAKIVKDFGGKPFIADSPAWRNVWASIKSLQLDGPLKKLGVDVVPLNRPKRFKTAGGNIGISSVALDADRIINLPKFKAHQQLGATFAVKNMFGCVCGKEKAFRHFTAGQSCHKFCRMLIEIYDLLAPVITIIDGIVAMEGAGPINGKPKKLGVLVAGDEPIACERVCCELIGLAPDELPMIQTAMEMDLGCADLDDINILGDDYAELICTDFIRAQQIPLRFSLPRVCKSVFKQLIYLLGRKSNTNS